MATLKAQFPEKTGFLFEPHRYKVLYGGRGSGKSFAVARYLLITGLTEPHRVLCTREVQKSLRDSVKRLLMDQIEELGLDYHYDIFDSEIRGKNGTLFLFSGLSTQTADSLKSYEKLSKVWCEEAHSISKRSWDILIPTVRADNSEILITFNPELETDITYERFVLNPPEDCVAVHMNHTDNPWFPSVLEKERLHCKLTDPRGYDNIWEGMCKPAVAGAIYYDEMAAAEANGQICNVPYDPLLKVHVVFDLGWNDTMFITLVQRVRSEIRVIEEMEDSHKTLDWYSAELKKKNYNWGFVFLPHDGFSKDYKSGKSTEEILTALHWHVIPRKQIVEMSVEEGIKATRLVFRQMYFNKPKTERLVQCLKRYRRSINQTTNEPGVPFHDEWSHGADNMRYIAINADSMTNEEYYDDDDDDRQYQSRGVGGY